MNPPIQHGGLSPDRWADEVVAFGRAEAYRTQHAMPSGYRPLEQFNRSAWVVGAAYLPDPDVAFKWDVVWERNQSTVVRGPWKVNLGVGWWF